MAQAAQKLVQRIAVRGPQLLSGERREPRGAGGVGAGLRAGPAEAPPLFTRRCPVAARSRRRVLQAAPGHVLVLRQGGAGPAEPRRDPAGHRQHEGPGARLPERPPAAAHGQGNGGGERCRWAGEPPWGWLTLPRRTTGRRRSGTSGAVFCCSSLPWPGRVRVPGKKDEQWLIQPHRSLAVPVLPASMGRNNLLKGL